MIDSERRLYIRQLSAKLLLAQNNLSPVIDVRDMVLPKNIFILSFDEYSRITGYPVKELTHNGTYIDGYTIIADNMKIVLYSSKYDFLCPQRLRFSLAHEIGHIFLRHTEDDDKSEEEANYFASQVVAHDAIVVSMLTGNWNVDLDFIRDQLGISWDTAILKLKYINRNKKLIVVLNTNFLRNINIFSVLAKTKEINLQLLQMKYTLNLMKLLRNCCAY